MSLNRTTPEDDVQHDDEHDDDDYTCHVALVGVGPVPLPQPAGFSHLCSTTPLKPLHQSVGSVQLRVPDARLQQHVEDGDHPFPHEVVECLGGELVEDGHHLLTVITPQVKVPTGESTAQPCTQVCRVAPEGVPA